MEKEKRIERESEPGDLSLYYSKGCKLSLLRVKAGNANDDKAFPG